MPIEKSTKIIICLVATALALCLADIATTYVAVSNGAQELNPAVASDIVNYGLVTALLFTLPVPVFASIVSISGTMICNRTLNREMGLSVSERGSIKMYVAVGLAFLLSVVILVRGWAVCNNLLELIGAGII